MWILNQDPDGDYEKYGVWLTLLFVIPYRMILALWALVGIAFVYCLGAVIMCIMFMILVNFIFAISSPLHYVW